MLDELEWKRIHPRLSDGIRAIKDYRGKHGTPLAQVPMLELYEAAVEELERMTGYSESHPEHLWHHRRSIHGPLCASCERPLRTPRAKLCVCCGARRDRDEVNEEYCAHAVDAMRRAGIDFAPGLTDAQFAKAEAVHGFCFPSDLRMFLAHGLPVGDRFPDWRRPRSRELRKQMTWPLEGICFDVEHNDFWHPLLGDRPRTLIGAKHAVKRALRAAPALVPIFAHRYLPVDPCEPGNPVLSVYQCDVIYYGMDLPSYLFAEFGVPNPFPVADEPRAIAFWPELAGLDDEED